MISFIRKYSEAICLYMAFVIPFSFLDMVTSFIIGNLFRAYIGLVFFILSVIIYYKSNKVKINLPN